jgi:zinc protease
MRRLILFIVAMLMVLPLGASENSQVPLPKDLPPYGPLKATPAPNLTQVQLPNGLTVWLLPRPGFPKVRFLLTVRGGLEADPKELPGVSEFLAATVGQGTTTRSAKQIAEQVQGAGGEFRAQANGDALWLETSVLAGRADTALAVLSDVSQHATFPEAEVEIARRNLTNSMQRRQSDATYMARRALAAAMFGDHPYAVIGPTGEALTKTTPAELRSEYARRFRPDQALLLVIGDFNVDHLNRAVEQQFGKWQAPAEEKISDFLAPEQRNKATIFSVPRPNSVQTRFFAATLGPTETGPDYAAVSVATLVYGMRVSKNVREDKGYAYSSGAEAQLQRKANLLITAAAVRNEVTGPSWNEMSYEMNRMATTAPTKEEVERVKHFLIGYDALNLQTLSGMGTRLSQLWINGLPPEQLGREGENIEKVNIADVERIGRKYFPASQMTIVAIGDEQVIKQQLSIFGLAIKTQP